MPPLPSTWKGRGGQVSVEVGEGHPVQLEASVALKELGLVRVVTGK